MKLLVSIISLIYLLIFIPKFGDYLVVFDGLGANQSKYILLFLYLLVVVMAHLISKSRPELFTSMLIIIVVITYSSEFEYLNEGVTKCGYFTFEKSPDGLSALTVYKQQTAISFRVKNIFLFDFNGSLGEPHIYLDKGEIKFELQNMEAEFSQCDASGSKTKWMKLRDKE
ncbi:hypothetical protein, partial [Shewanella sp. MBTL60-112-B2]|uniref:hypothetical protein n=1 Tax=Shewanella sp. MBTL60-112-B2 TaxID=2815917 RepID=UPI001C808170